MLTPAEIAKLQDEALLKLHIPRHETKAKLLGDFLRTFIKQEQYQTALKNSSPEERKQIAEEFLGARGATVPYDSINREYFWPDHDLHEGLTWVGESFVQDTLADWLYYEVGQKPAKRHKPRLSIGSPTDGETHLYETDEAPKSNRNQLDREESTFSPIGDIPHTEPRAEMSTGKRKAFVDVYDIDVDEQNSGADAEPSSTKKSHVDSVQKPRPRKLIRFNGTPKRGDRLPIGSGTGTSGSPTPSAPHRSRADADPHPRPSSSIILESFAAEVPQARNDANAVPEIKDTSTRENLSGVQAQFGPLGARMIAKAVELSNSSATVREDYIRDVRQMQTLDGKGTLTHIAQAPRQSGHLRNTAFISMPPRCFPRKDFAEIPSRFLKHIEAKERGHLSQAQMSNDIDEIKLALTKAKMLQDLRDDLKAIEEEAQLEVKPDGSVDFSVA